MALMDFLKKKDEKEKKIQKGKPTEEKTEKKAESTKKGKDEVLSKASILLAPYVTEKSSNAEQKGIYVFKVKGSTNKIEIKKEIKKLFGVMPERVNITNIPSRTVYIGRRKAERKGYKKAVIQLKKGDKLSVVQ